MKTTHIGSLPFLNIDDAIAFNKKFDTPVLSTLPVLNKNEFMLDQLLGGIQGSDIVNYRIQLNAKYKLQKFKIPFILEDKFLRSFSVSTMKWQVVGFITFLKSIDIQLSLLQIEELRAWYLENVYAYHKFLKQYFEEVILFVDEPMFNNENDLKEFIEYHQELKKNIDTIYVHCCNYIGPLLLKEISDINISLDCFLYKEVEIKLISDQISMVALGVISAISLETIRQNLSTIDNCEYLTPSCGLAYSEIDNLVHISSKLRNNNFTSL